MKLQVTICGGGNAAHTLAGILGSQANLTVRVYAPFGSEAAQWQEGIRQQGGIKVASTEGVQLGILQRVSDQARLVIPGSQVVILALPAFAHESTITEIAPYLDRGAWVGAMPARGGFDLGARPALDAQAGQVTLFGFQTLPWACRIQRFGQEALVLGAKQQVDIATWPPEQAAVVARQMEEILGVHLNPVASFLSLTLADVGQLIHPGIMYGLFHNWDGSPYQAPPLFYQGVDQETAAFLQRMSDEVQQLRRAIEARIPDLDLSAVYPLGEWLLRSYSSAIENAATIQSCFVTNRGYTGLTAPMRPVSGGFVPDFSARYLSEDVPFGLLVTRGIAELAGVPTPSIDQVLIWAQAHLGKQYLWDDQLHAANLQNTRTPQRYGLTCLEHLLEMTPLTGRSPMNKTSRLTPTEP